ncbi:MAG: tyrosine-type recombinase/integrase [Oligoflexales bacterium]
MPLTNTQIKNAKPKEKTYKLFDGGGLHLEISKSGGKWWRYKYRYAGKEKKVSLGVYPDVTLKDARTKHQEYRTLLAGGINPSEHKKAFKTALRKSSENGFEIIAREWFNKNEEAWNAAHAKRIIRSLELNVFPWIGNTPIDKIKPIGILQVIRRIEERGTNETAHRILSRCRQIFRYAIATSRLDFEPCSDLKGALTPATKNHFPAITSPKNIGPLLRALDSYQGSDIVKAALRLAPLVFVRPGELRHAKWENFDLKTNEWSFVLSKTKQPLIVPLSKQATKIINTIKPITNVSPYVFHSARDRNRPMSDNAILAALRRLDISKDEMTGHGFRAMARTVLDEVLGFRPDIIEHQLGHAVRDPHGRAYNRTAHLQERKNMMQVWANYLEELKTNHER